MSSRRFRSLLPLLAATVHLAFLVWQAPHTVHHFFERDVQKQNECAASAAAERSAGTVVAPVSIAPVAGFELAVAPFADDVFARPTRSLLRPRAPPSPAA